MYSLPSTSNKWDPAPLAMNKGFPPTALNARTGEFTPPGMISLARSKSRLDFSYKPNLQSNNLRKKTSKPPRRQGRQEIIRNQRQTASQRLRDRPPIFQKFHNYSQVPQALSWRSRRLSG